MRCLGLTREDDGISQLVISRGLKSGKLDYIPMSDTQLRQLLVQVAQHLALGSS